MELEWGLRIMIYINVNLDGLNGFTVIVLEENVLVCKNYTLKYLGL